MASMLAMLSTIDGPPPNAAAAQRGAASPGWRTSARSSSGVGVVGRCPRGRRRRRQTTSAATSTSVGSSPGTDRRRHVGGDDVARAARSPRPRSPAEVGRGGHQRGVLPVLLVALGPRRAQRVGDGVRAQRAGEPALGDQPRPARARSAGRRRGRSSTGFARGRPGCRGARLPAARRPRAGPPVAVSSSSSSASARTGRARRRRAAGRGRR